MRPRHESISAATVGSSRAISVVTRDTTLQTYKAYILRRRKDLKRGDWVVAAWQSPKPVDPIVSAIERARAARMQWDDAMDGTPEYRAAEKAFHRANDALLRVTATTKAGLYAAIEHLQCSYDAETVMPVILRSLRRMAD